MLYELYIFLLIFNFYWMGIFIDFVLGLLSIKKSKDIIFVIVDNFSKMVYFILCYKIDDVLYVVDLFFKEVVWLYGIFKIIVFNRDVKFFNYFWKVLWG